MVTILMISAVSFFGAEILTGSTSIQGIFQYPLSFVAGLAFYGFQISILIDISARYNLGMNTVYLLGLAYGILEEGIAIFTMEATATHTLWLSLFGLNETWTVYVMILHAVITVTTTLLVLRVVSPGRVEKPFLSKGKYIFMLPVTIVIYYFLEVSSIEAGRAPQILPVLFLAAILVMLILIAISKTRRSAEIPEPMASRNVSSLSGSLPFAAGMVLPFILGNRVPMLLIPETLLLLVLLLYLYIYFKRVGSVKNVSLMKQWELYSSFLIVMLVGGVFNRSVISDALGLTVAAILITAGFARSRAIPD